MTSDVIVIGGGPAGLSAALVIARAGLKAHVLDAGTPRNASAPAMHGMIGHEGITPAAFRERAWAELMALGVSQQKGRVASLERRGDLVAAGIDDGTTRMAHRALVAVGLVDLLPKLAGIRECWGKSAFGCPHCHGFEHRDQRWGLLAMQRSMVGMAPLYLRWTKSLTLMLDGRTDIEAERLTRLSTQGISHEAKKIVALEHEAGRLTGARLDDGSLHPLDALLLHPPQRQTDVVLFAGLALNEEGMVRIDDEFRTSMAGVHAAGDCAGSSPRAIAAAAHGADAAVAIVEGWNGP